MPPREVFSVNFRNGNLTPVTTLNWGTQVMGGSANGGYSVQQTSRGLRLHATRAADATTLVANSIYLLPPVGALPLASRLRLRVWFEQPWAEPLPGSSVPPENWAVALVVKFKDEVDLPENDPFAAVTCQFRRTADDSGGVRLNAVGELQKDQAGYIDRPINYHRYRAGCLGFGRAPVFMLEHTFSGVQAGPETRPPLDIPELGHSVGSGFLSIDGRTDQRVYSSSALSTGEQSWIGAIGVSLATLSAFGTYRVTLKGFAVELW